jgi:hypothetical protein
MKAANTRTRSGEACRTGTVDTHINGKEFSSRRSFLDIRFAGCNFIAREKVDFTETPVCRSLCDHRIFLYQLNGLPHRHIMLM